jgi:hypothetical protein
MAVTVTLRWKDDPAADEFLRLREELCEWGYVTDSDGDKLQCLVALSELCNDQRDTEAALRGT